jgi:hypothetical protein
VYHPTIAPLIGEAVLHCDPLLFERGSFAEAPGQAVGLGREMGDIEIRTVYVSHDSCT